MDLKFRKAPKVGYFKVQPEIYVKASKLLDVLRSGNWTLEKVISKAQGNEVEPLHYRAELKEDEALGYVDIFHRNDELTFRISDMVKFCKAGFSLNNLYRELLKLYQLKHFAQADKIGADEQ